MKDKSTKTLKISNFNIASILLYEGIELLGLEKDLDNPHKMLFVFPLDENIEPLTDSLWAKRLRVEPLKFIEMQKYLKSRLHSQI